MIEYRTCAFCKKGARTDRMVKYSTRRYSHHGCLLERLGERGFARLHLWQLEQFPALIAAEHELLDALIAEVDRRKAGAKKLGVAS